MEPGHSLMTNASPQKDELQTDGLLEEKPKNFAPSPDFRWLCEELFVRVEEVQRQGRERGGSKPISARYYEVLAHFVKLWRKTVGNDIYPAMVLVLPYRDKRVYNIKDHTLIKAVCSYLALPKQSSTERRLMKWKRRTTKGIRLSSFCVEEIRKRKSEPSPSRRVTIDKLNECLDQLVQERNARGGFKGLSDSPSFNFCLQNMSFLELKFFFDILLKNRLIGGHEHKFLNCWHPDAQDYLSVVSDLKTVTDKLWNPERRLRKDDLSINIGYAFVPHLAKRLTISYEKICNKLKNDFLIEEKMDGERIQVHYMDYGTKVRFFSRRGVDYTYLYGESTKVGTIAQYFRFDKNVKDCVLDGEMVTFDLDQNAVLPFGLVKTSAKQALTTEGILTQGYRPLLMVLDLVYLNGTSLVKLPLHQRKDYLRTILRPSPHAVDILPYVRCFDQIAIRKSLEIAISMGSEGIVLKNYNSKYEIGARNDNWIKIKPEYLEQFGENLDLVIIGRDPGIKDSLMCGLAVYEGEEDFSQFRSKRERDIVNLDSDVEEMEDTDGKKVIKRFVSFCTIANGISQDEFKEIDRKTRGYWVKSDQRLPAAGLLQFGSKVPEEWIDPKKSIIIEVKARSLDNTESSKNKFSAGCTLYGGYCRRIRDDKDWTGCYSLSDLWQERRHKSSGALGAHHRAVEKMNRTKKRKLGIFLGQSLEDAEVTIPSNIFQGLQFYVMSDYIDSVKNLRITKTMLDSLIVRNNGKLIKNLISKHHIEGHFRIISGRYTGECRTLIERGYDIISPQWILDCVNNSSLVKLEPRHCFNVSNELMTVVKGRIDKFGDSFVNITSEEQLDGLIDANMASASTEYRENAGLSNEIETIPLFLLTRRIVYIPEAYFSRAYADALKFKIKLYGGSLTSDVTSCNLIVVSNPDNAAKSSLLEELRRSISQCIADTENTPVIPRIVTPDWLEKSIEENFQVPEEDFVPL